jgi:hypothetical protein
LIIALLSPGPITAADHAMPQRELSAMACKRHEIVTKTEEET